MPGAIASWSPSPAKPRTVSKVGDDVGVLAVGVCAGQNRSAVDLSSVALLGSGLLELLEEAQPERQVHHDYTVHTYREAFEPALIEESERWSSSNSDSSSSGISSAKRPFEVSYACERLAEQTYRQIQKGVTALTLGGDHSVALGTFAGTARACRDRFGTSPALIWVDARTSMHTPESSASGHINGMALSFLSGLAKTAAGEPFSWLEETTDGHDPVLDLSNLVYIGLRDIDPVEQGILKKHSIKAFTMQDVQSMGIDRVMDEALSYIGSSTPVHLSVGFNALSVEPCVSRAITGLDGLTVEETKSICQRVRQSQNMVAMDLVEISPVGGLDDGGYQAYQTVQAALSVVGSAFGGK